MVMSNAMDGNPTSVFGAMAEASLQVTRERFWTHAVLVCMQEAGMSAEYAIEKADELLAAFDQRSLAPGKPTFGLPKGKGE